MNTIIILPPGIIVFLPEFESPLLTLMIYSFWMMGICAVVFDKRKITLGLVLSYVLMLIATLIIPGDIAVFTWFVYDITLAIITLIKLVWWGI